MAQSLELLLIQFLMPDNDARRQAEDQIKRLAKDPQVVPALAHHLRTAKTPNVRQLAAVLLRKKITGHWAKLTPQLRQLVKQSLIESITLEHRFAIDTAFYLFCLSSKLDYTIACFIFILISFSFDISFIIITG